MKAPDNLYGLIKSLTKTEKAYFKKYASRHVHGDQNKYVMLFDEITRNENGYNEKEIKNKFRSEKFVKNFPVIKKYLSEMILKSLNSFYSDSEFENKIKNEVRYIEILFRKGLFESCSKIIKAAKKRAYKTDNFLLILELLKWEKNILNSEKNRGDGFKILEAACMQEQEIINKLKNLSEYRLISYRVRNILVSDNESEKQDLARTELNDALGNPLLQSEKNALSYPALLSYYHILADIHDSLGNKHEAFENRKRLVQSMEKHSETKKVNISNYVIVLFNLLGTCLNLRNYDELENYIDQLREIGKTCAGKYSENDRLLIFMGSYIFKLRMNIAKGEFSSSTQLMLDIENALKEFAGKIIKPDELYFYYLLGYAYFGAAKYNEALNWINKVINDKNVYQDRKLLVKSKILQLILHYELENYELLDYLVKSTYRLLNKVKIKGREEIVVIEFLKSLPHVSTQKQLLSLFEDSLIKLKSRNRNNYANNNGTGSFEIQNNFTNIAEFDVISWLESKVSNKQFEVIVRRKNQSDT